MKAEQLTIQVAVDQLVLADLAVPGETQAGNFGPFLDMLGRVVTATGPDGKEFDLLQLPLSELEGVVVAVNQAMTEATQGN